MGFLLAFQPPTASPQLRYFVLDILAPVGSPQVLTCWSCLTCAQRSHSGDTVRRTKDRILDTAAEPFAHASLHVPRAPAARAPPWLRAQAPAGAARAAGRRTAEPGFREGGGRRIGAGQAREKQSDWSDRGSGLGGRLGPGVTLAQSRVPPPHLVDFVKHINRKLWLDPHKPYACNGTTIKHLPPIHYFLLI